jgi:hypothetical protein
VQPACKGDAAISIFKLDPIEIVEGTGSEQREYTIHHTIALLPPLEDPLIPME